MRATPPHLLLTNYAMLEYLLLRPADMDLFEGEHAGCWQFLVLDEAHVYDGARAAEVAMLLRRLRDRVARDRPLRYIATSATVGDKAEDVTEFAHRLFDAPFEWVPGDPARQDLVRASRKELPKPPFWGPLDPAAYLKIANADDPAKELLRRAPVERYGRPATASRVPSSRKSPAWPGSASCSQPVRRWPTSSPTSCSTRKTRRRTAAVSSTRWSPRAAGSSDRTAWPCCLPATTCSSAPPKAPTRACPRPARTSPSPAMSAVPSAGPSPSSSARASGAVLSTYPERSVATRGSSPSDRRSQASPARGFSLTGAPTSSTRTTRPSKSRPGKLDSKDAVLCASCGGMYEGSRATCGRAGCGGARLLPVRRLNTPKDTITGCLVCGGRGAAMVRGFESGGDAAASVLSTSLYQALPPAPDPEQADQPGEGRKLLLFSDSRQAAAFFAPYLETSYEAIQHRRLILEGLRARGGRRRGERQRPRLPRGQGGGRGPRLPAQDVRAGTPASERRCG